MTAVLDLPTRERFDVILEPILGNGNGQSGLQAAARLLESVDAAELSQQLTDRLDGVVAGAIAMDPPGDGVEDLSDRIQAVVEASSVEPGLLLRGLTSRLEAIKDRVVTDLSASLNAALAELDTLQSLIPTDTTTLLEGLDPAIDAIKSELISGTFGQLRTWSEQVSGLYDEVEDVFVGGTGSLQERIIQWVADKVADVVAALLPTADTPADAIVAGFRDIAEGAHSSAVNGALEAFEAALDRLKTKFQAGDYTALGFLAEAEGHLATLVSSLEQVSGSLSAVLASGADLSDLDSELHRRIASVSDTEVVDLGAIGDTFGAAIAGVQSQIDSIDLDSVAGTIRAPLERLAEVADSLDLGQLTTGLETIGGDIDEMVQSLQGGLLETIAAVGTAVGTAGVALRDAASTMGRFDDDGTFEFHIETQIRSYLEGVQAGLDGTVLATIGEFQANLGATLSQVEQALTSVQGQIEAVRGELEQALQGAADHLDRLDIKQRVDGAADAVRQMLDQLAGIDFEVVINPVVAEIDSMRGSLVEIDTSSMNPILRESLGLAVDVVIHIDFAADVSAVLLEKIDEILEAPKRALSEVEQTLQESLAQLEDLAPGAILASLEGIFTPIATALDGLSLDALAGPLNDWRDETVGQLAQVSPGALLQPFVERHRDLDRIIGGLDPTELAQPISSAIDALLEEIDDIDITGLADGVGEKIAQAREAIGQLSPERLLAPASFAFAKILGALDDFDPAVLLEPFSQVFGKLEAALDGLGDEHVVLLQSALAPLAALPQQLDPEVVYASLRDEATGAATLIRELDVGGLLSRLQDSYTGLLAKVDPVAAGTGVTDRLAALNPLRHEQLSRAVSTLASQIDRLENDLATARPTDGLTAAYASVAAKIESLVPDWVQPDMTAESIRRAVRTANPLAVEEEVRGVWAAVIDKLRILDPMELVEPLEALLERIEAPLEGLDPQAAVAIGQTAIEQVGESLRSLDLEMLTSELTGPLEDVRGIVAALDPSAVIAKLDEVSAAVTDAVAALDPHELLVQLEGPVEAARAIMREVDPASLSEPLESVFEPIQDAISAVDIAALLTPIVEKLDELRDSLAAGLERTETSFNGMLAAIPL